MDRKNASATIFDMLVTATRLAYSVDTPDPELAVRIVKQIHKMDLFLHGLDKEVTSGKVFTEQQILDMIDEFYKLMAEAESIMREVEEAEEAEEVLTEKRMFDKIDKFYEATTETGDIIGEVGKN